MFSTYISAASSQAGGRPTSCRAWRGGGRGQATARGGGTITPLAVPSMPGSDWWGGSHDAHPAPCHPQLAHTLLTSMWELRQVASHWTLVISGRKAQHGAVTAPSAARELEARGPSAPDLLRTGGCGLIKVLSLQCAALSSQTHPKST